MTRELNEPFPCAESETGWAKWAKGTCAECLLADRCSQDDDEGNLSVGFLGHDCADGPRVALIPCDPPEKEACECGGIEVCTCKCEELTIGANDSAGVSISCFASPVKTKPCPACDTPLELPTQFFDAVKYIREEVESSREVYIADHEASKPATLAEALEVIERADGYLKNSQNTRGGCYCAPEGKCGLCILRDDVEAILKKAGRI